MNRLGMMVDVSHVSDKTFWDLSKLPANRLSPLTRVAARSPTVPRNLTDEMIVALAKTGGVVNVIFYPEYIEPGWSEKKKQVDAEIAPLVQRARTKKKATRPIRNWRAISVRREEYAKRLPPVSVSRLVDHIDHVVKLVGIDHVGIGSDFDGFSRRSVIWLPSPIAELDAGAAADAAIRKATSTRFSAATCCA